jgi:hypothetical protein
MRQWMNVRAARKPASKGVDDGGSRRWEDAVEVVEVLLLAVVTIATAWSGYQAAQWNAQQALFYGQASRDRFEADAASTLGGQSLVADAATFTAWLEAHAAGDQELASLFIRRFTPEYRIAFDAWLETDPFDNPQAPPGPGHMPEYHNPQMEQAARLNAGASTLFDEGTEARETANLYVRDTVLFASVLFLVAIAQRFKVRNVRFGANALAFTLLAFTATAVATLPRI